MAVSTLGITFLPPGCWSCRYMKVYIIRRWDFILPGCDRTSTLARGATLPVRWFYEPQQSVDRGGVSAPCGATSTRRTGGPPFSPPYCRICRCMEDVMTWGWDVILPGCGGVSTPSREATLAARWPCEPQPISNQWMGVDFTPCGATSTRGSLFSSPGCWICT